jgi:hypothetical protein
VIQDDGTVQRNLEKIYRPDVKEILHHAPPIRNEVNGLLFIDARAPAAWLTPRQTSRVPAYLGRQN